ncbi:MAG: bacterial transcriptional activator domain-containing protein [Gammaproteobacteria bacterium]|nr:bacterial transcriptional activator domain-containing protein [Gammaproteobacteria bacterium]
METSLYKKPATSGLQPLDIDFLIKISPPKTISTPKQTTKNRDLSAPADNRQIIAGASDSYPIVITTLGHFAIHKHGQLISSHEKNQHKPSELLKLVIALGGRSVGEIRISDALWPDADGDVAHTSFSVTLHRIRKFLTMESMLLADGHLTLNPQVCWVDVWALEDILNDIKYALRCSNVDLEKIRTLANQALNLYQGHFLGNEDEQSWFIAFREKQKSRFIRSLEHVCDAFEQHRQCHLAIDYYRKGIEIDPLSEAFYQRLMKCYAQRGRKIEAIAVYQQCQRLFKALTGFEPSAATSAIYQQVLRAAA